MTRSNLAEEFLKDAENNLAAGSLRTSVSRSYYAVYHACVHLFETRGFKAKHFIGRDGLPGTYWAHWIITRKFHIQFCHRTPVIPWAVGVMVRQLYYDRVVADYRVDLSVTRSSCEDSLQVAKKVVHEIRKVVS